MDAGLPPFRFADLRRGGGDDRAELLAGLKAARASIPPKYFYDALGSSLFAAICCLPEYGLTRSEARILAAAKVLEDILGLRGTTPIDPIGSSWPGMSRPSTTLI